MRHSKIGYYCCGPSFSIIALILIIVSVVLPWFVMTTQVSSENINEHSTTSTLVSLASNMISPQEIVLDDCAYMSQWGELSDLQASKPTRVRSRFWKYFTCHTTADILTCDKEKVDWREEQCTDNKCEDLSNTYYTAEITSIISAIFTFFAVILFFVRACCITKPGVHAPTLVIQILSFLASLVAIISFLATHVPAMRDAFAGSLDCPSDQDSPCESLVGSLKYTFLTYSITYSWLPLGTFVCVAASFIQLITILFACIAGPPPPQQPLIHQQEQAGYEVHSPYRA